LLAVIVLGVNGWSACGLVMLQAQTADLSQTLRMVTAFPVDAGASLREKYAMLKKGRGFESC